VEVAGDSISGVPFVDPPECVTCRESLPLPAVDSVRTGQPVGGFWRTAALLVGGLFVAMWVVCDFTPCYVGN
jgi:hypothetical protein